MSWKGHQDQRWGGFTYSQHFEDGMMLNLLELMGHQGPVTYLDVGCHHPWNISNTALFYLRGGSGVCIDANPNVTLFYRTERPRDTVLNIGIGAKPGRAEYYLHDALSGLNTFSIEEKQRMSEAGFPFDHKLEIEVVTLTSIVEKYLSKWPDVLSLDLEGKDFEVLQSLSLREIGPKIVCVEVRPNELETFNIEMFRQGYMLMCRMGMNQIYVRYDLYDLAKGWGPGTGS